MTMSSLAKVLSTARPDIEDVAFVIASDAYPGLRVARYRHALDDMVAPIASKFATADDRVKREGLTEHLYGALGFCGNEEDYYDPRNSYLNEVIDRRTGIPITLAVVYMALGRRLGLCVEGVGFPGHFIVRVGGENGVYVDAFNYGRVLSRDHLEDSLTSVMPDTAGLVEGQLEPVGPRVMAVRMLFNLQKIYERRGDHARALVACDRLVDIADAPFHLRDRGRHAMALGAWRAAIDDFTAYLSATTEPVDQDHITALLMRARKHEEGPSN